MNNTETVQAAYAAFGQGDMPGLLTHVADGVEWEYYGPDIIPWAGSFRGHDGVIKFITTLGQNTEFHEFEPHSFTAEGDKVIVLGRQRCTFKPTGRDFDVNWTHAFTLKDGKVTAFREYTDTAAVAEACRS